MEKFISYICGKGANGTEPEGVGFFVGNLFITAGHVIKDGTDFTMCYQGVTYKLNKSDALYYTYMDDGSITPDGNDIAIFRFENINSPLTLLSEISQRGMELRTVTKRRHAVSNGKFSLLDNDYKEVIQAHTIVTKVVDFYENLIECSADSLRKGDSGSPFLNGDNVYGVLIAGKRGTNVCVFQSSKSIIEIIKDIEYE